MEYSDLLKTYFEESFELLNDMEGILLNAEQTQPEAEELNALFRCAHTIKGSGDMCGLTDVVAFTHEVETVLDYLRKETLDLTPPLLELLLDCRDHILALITEAAEQQPADHENGAKLLESLSEYSAKLNSEAELNPPTPSIARIDNDCSFDEMSAWHISARFEKDLMHFGLDPLSMISYLASLGNIVHIETVIDYLPNLYEIDPEICYLGFEISFKTDMNKEQIEAVFEFVNDQEHIKIYPPETKIDEFISLIESYEDETRLGELLIACGSITQKELSKALNKQNGETPKGLLGEVLIDQQAVPTKVVNAALKKQAEISETKARESKSIKVSADRLDELIDQVGELVIASASTELQAKKINDTDLLESAETLLRLIEEVRDTALKLRMTPVNEVFNRFPRVVRDISKELGKQISLDIQGAETELDKTMIEKIGDPLMHLIRNSIDHGIESPDDRRASGKPETGTVSLNAYHESGSIVIEVKDDGKGLDAQRILTKAIENGLVSDNAQLSNEEIYQLILAPGFSTAETVTNLSGRGVGMDVVKNNIETLRGTLTIESEPGKGSTMRIFLPLTLSIIDGFKVGVGFSTFIIPLDNVIECIELEDLEASQDFINLRGELLPFIRLRNLFNISDTPIERQNLVIVRFCGQKTGIIVDKLYGESQTVIKPLGTLFTKLQGISGSTILGNGEVALIIDIAQLLQTTLHNKNTSFITGSK